MLQWATDGSGTLVGDVVAQMFAHASAVATRQGASTMHVVTFGPDAAKMSWGNATAPPGMAGMTCLQAAAFSGTDHTSYIVLNRCNGTLNVTLPPPLPPLSPGGSTAAWTIYDCGPKSAIGFAPLPNSSHPFPWPGPIKPTTGTTATDAVSGASIVLTGMSTLIATVR
jgi:hypothetical protein